MKEETRYRVTGSLFLLALVVIFLPMVFDGAGLPPVEIAPVAEQPVSDAEAPEPARAPSELIPQVEALRDQIDDAGFVTKNGTRMGEPVLSDVQADTKTWAVQVASFEDASNAAKFRSRLREDNYEAFLSTLRSGDEVRTRVAVGPLLSREKAEQLQAELSTRYRVTARLKAFSN